MSLLVNSAEVVGVYLSDAPIKFAKNRTFAKPVNFQTGDAMTLPFEADTFSAATLALVLFFILNSMFVLAKWWGWFETADRFALMSVIFLGDGLPIKMTYKEFLKQGIEYLSPPSAKYFKIERREKLWAEVGSDFSITFTIYCKFSSTKIKST